MNAGAAAALVCLAVSAASAAIPPEITRQQALDAVIRADLATSKAATTTDLAPELPLRVLGAGAPVAALYTDGHTWRVPVALDVAGGPFHVPTELSLNYVVRLTRGKTTILSRPSRDDLASAVRLAAVCEAKILEPAGKALDATGRKPPMGSWASALTSVRLDPRLPASEFVGPATWMLLFEPKVMDGGWNSVSLDTTHCGVITVNGKAP